MPNRDHTTSAALGGRVWVIPEGYLPEGSTGPAPELSSHETFCVLNAGDDEAHLRVTVYFSDREPVGPYEV